MQAILNGIICKRSKPPTHYEGTNIEIPPVFRTQKTRQTNRWVTAVSAGPHCREDIKPGDRIYIGAHVGTSFEHEHEKYVLIWDTDVLVRER
jgi:co-chaperonin GroES (HSP10)